jgi:hypothetical protein
LYHGFWDIRGIFSQFHLLPRIVGVLMLESPSERSRVSGVGDQLFCGLKEMLFFISVAIFPVGGIAKKGPLLVKHG